MIKSSTLITSDFVTCISVRDSFSLREQLIDPLVQRFFQANEVEHYQELGIEHSFSDLDFYNFSFDKIYGLLLTGIKRPHTHVEVPVKFCLTIDKQNCSQKCKKTDIFYDIIEINDKPFFYFIYIDILTIITTLRSTNSKSTL